jgi:hypothetical protein
MTFLEFFCELNKCALTKIAMSTDPKGKMVGKKISFEMSFLIKLVHFLEISDCWIRL